MTESFKMVSDEQLIAAVLDGDIASFGVIVERYWKMAAALALSSIQDASEAEDIAQESLIKAYSQLHKLRDPSRFAGWLAKIIAQQSVDHIRKSVRDQNIITYKNSVETLESYPAYRTNPGLSEDEVNHIRQTIRRLPEKFRNIVIMRFSAGLSTAEIAKNLGKRHGTVRVYLHRAYQILRKELAPLLEEVK